MLDLDKTNVEVMGKSIRALMSLSYGFIFDDLNFRTMDTEVSLPFSIDLLDLFHLFILSGFYVNTNNIHVGNEIDLIRRRSKGWHFSTVATWAMIAPFKAGISTSDMHIHNHRHVLRKKIFEVHEDF